MIMILQFFNNFKHITCLLIEYLKISLFTVIRHLFVSLLTDIGWWEMRVSSSVNLIGPKKTGWDKGSSFQPLLKPNFGDVKDGHKGNRLHIHAGK